jgi:hypothetical protein
MGGVFDFLCFKVKKQVSRKGAKGAKKKLHLRKEEKWILTTERH